MSASVSIAHDDAPSLLIDVTVNLGGLDAALDSVIVRALAGRGFTLFTLNLDHLVKMRKNSSFREAYSAADFITADGWPVVWMLRRQGYPAERATGADLVEPLCALAGQNGLAVYFIGPSEASQAKALEVLRQRYRGLYVAGAETPDLRATLTKRRLIVSLVASASWARACASFPLARRSKNCWRALCASFAPRSASFVSARGSTSFPAMRSALLNGRSGGISSGCGVRRAIRDASHFAISSARPSSVPCFGVGCSILTRSLSFTVPAMRRDRIVRTTIIPCATWRAAFRRTFYAVIQ